MQLILFLNYLITLGPYQAFWEKQGSRNEFKDPIENHLNNNFLLYEKELT